MKASISVVLCVPVNFRGMVKVGIFAWHVRERVMSNHMLVIPNVGCAEVKPNFGPQGIDAPVSREREVACIVEDIHAMDPQSDWEG
jgi:hypothetical protein